jgi:N-acetylneuraminic acid mutarotase
MKKIYLLAALAFLASTLSGQTDWVKHPDNPVLEPGVEGDWDEGYLHGGSVIFHDDTFRTWYSKGYPATTDPYIGYATSTDGVHWTKYGDNPVLVSGPGGSWDEYKVVFPTVLIRDMVYHMWYIGEPGGSDFHEYKIGHATSVDGIHWEKDSQNPVIEKGPGGSPDANYIFMLSAVHDDSLFHLWYSANNGVDDLLYTCHATSLDGTNWSKDPENPVLTGDSWDNPICNPGPVFFDGSDFHMWYIGGESTTRSVGYATSSDGTVWVKQSDSPVLTGGQPGQWDEGVAGAKGIVYDNTNKKYLMWYSAGWNGVGYAESEPPQEAWTLLNNDARGGMIVSDTLIYGFAMGGEEGWWIGNETWRYNTNTNSWTQLADMPMSMTGDGSGQIGDKIYLVGGWQNTSDVDDSWITVDSILEYDMVKDTFIFRQKAPYRMGAMISCMMNDEMYLFGGMGIPGVLIYPYKARKYDPVNEIWDTTSIPDMQYPHLMHGTAEVVNGDIYVLGGCAPMTLDFAIQPSERYDGEKWEPIAEMPVPTVLHTSVIHENRILLFGGDDFWSGPTSNSIDLVQEYDPLTDSWRLMEPMPFRRSAMGGGKVGNFVYLTGGALDDRDPGTGVSEVWRFNLDSLQEWCEGISIMEPTDPLVIGDEVTLTASVFPSDFANKEIIWSSDNESVVSVLDSMNGIFRCENAGTATITSKLKFGGCADSYTLTVHGPAWILVNSDAKWGMTCVSDSLIYAFAGGKEYPWIGNETWRYNTSTNNWTQLADMPMAVYGEGIGQVGEKIYLVAGWRNASDADYSWITVDSIMEYDIARDTLIFRQKAPYKMGSMISCMMNDEMYLFGGVTGQGTIYPNEARKYDPVTEEWDTTSVPDMQYPHLMHGTAEVLDGMIYVLGGTGIPPDFSSQRPEKYDGSAWEPIAEMPVPSVLHTSVVHDNKILLFGGDSLWTPQSGNPTNVIQEYNPLDDSWRLKEPMPFIGASMVGGKVGNFVYLSGEPGTWRFDLDSLQEWCEEVSITEPADSLVIGDEFTLSATVLPTDFAIKDIIWSSDNESVISVLDSLSGIFRGESKGTATITASLKYGSCAESYALTVIDTSTTSIKPNTSNVHFSLYPNPVEDLLNVHVKSNGDHKIEITALTGQVVYSDVLERSEYVIDLSNFEKGIYFVTIRSKDLIMTEKIIKQ